MEVGRSLSLVALAGVLVAIPIFSQTEASKASAFEVASVRLNTSGIFRQAQTMEGRTYRATNVPAKSLILRAYDLVLQDYRLVGPPAWASSDRFDIVATLPENTTGRDIPTMLRALLAERFKLVVHTEARESPAYALVLARNDRRLGPQLQHAAVDCGASTDSGLFTPQPKPGDRQPCELEIGDAIKGRGQRLDVLARTLLLFVGRSVIDRTGLTGGFDFDLQAAEVAAGGRGGDDLPSVFTAVQEQLGLKLEPVRVPLEFVVIDSMDHPEPN
jgi:uncharacterized protein (TIGR03435 family)